MYFRLEFNYQRDCTRCCSDFIQQEFEIVQKNSYSMIIKTNKSCMEILKLACYYDVQKIRKCHIRNLFSKVVSKCR